MRLSVQVLSKFIRYSYVSSYYVSFFFFQAEDGIRDKLVTGVQTCALPISLHLGRTAGPEGTSIAWLDTETTGLAGGTGTYVFLIGIAAPGDGCVCLTQYFLDRKSVV